MLLVAVPELGAPVHVPAFAVHRRLPKLTLLMPWSAACATSQCAYCQPDRALATVSSMPIGPLVLVVLTCPQSSVTSRASASTAAVPRRVGWSVMVHATALPVSPISAEARIVAWSSQRAYALPSASALRCTRCAAVPTAIFCQPLTLSSAV